MTSTVTSLHRSSRVLLFVAIFFILGALSILTGSGLSPTVSVLARDKILCTGQSTIPQFVFDANIISTYTIGLCSGAIPSAPVTVTIKPEAGYESLFTIQPIDREFVFDTSNYTQTVRITLTPITDTQNVQMQVVFNIEHLVRSDDPNFDSAGVSALTIAVYNTLKTWLPVVSGIQPTPTPTLTPIPTPTPTPFWRQLSAQPIVADVITSDNRSLFAGGRSADAQDNGIYRVDQCDQMAPVKQNLQIYDLYIEGTVGVAATTGNRVYYSADNGNSWQETSSRGMDRNVFAVTKAEENNYYAGADDGLYRSTDSGITWQKISGGPSFINELVYDSLKTELWILTYGNGIWRYNPATGRFTEHNAGLVNENKERRVWDLAWYKNSRTYFIATSNGIYRGDGEGAWNQTILEDNIVLSLALVNESHLFAGTSANGAWEYDLNTGIFRQLPLDSSLIVSDLFDDREICQGLLAATTNGIWIYR